MNSQSKKKDIALTNKPSVTKKTFGWTYWLLDKLKKIGIGNSQNKLIFQ